MCNCFPEAAHSKKEYPTIRHQKTLTNIVKRLKKHIGPQNELHKHLISKLFHIRILNALYVSQTADGPTIQHILNNFSR